MSQKIQSVIFDMDGVIFDSERLYANACAAVGEQFGMKDIENVSKSCIGLNERKTYARFKEAYGEDYPEEEFWNAVRAHIRAEKAANGLPVKQGARELLQYLWRIKGITAALASSTATPLAMQNLEQAGLDKYFDVIIGGDQIRHGKPAPDIFLRAAALLRREVQDCAVVEDSYNGVRAAHNAGMTVIMIPDLLPPDDEMRAKAAVILPSLTEARDYIQKLIY